MLIRNCKHCGTEFEIYPSQPDKFCNKKCFADFFRGKPGRKQSKAECKKRSESLRGRIFSAETLVRMSEVQKGKRFSPEHRAKISATLSGRKLSPERIAKLTGRKPVPCEHGNPNTSGCQKCQRIAQRRHYYKHRILKPKKEKMSRAEINKKHSEYCQNRIKTDPGFQFGLHTRASIRRAFRGQGLKKNSKTATLLGISVKEFQVAVDKLFWPGMSWKNRHKWHLDHIRPCTDFDLTDPEQQKLCFHFSNWQPLWADDNRTKSDRLDWTPNESRHSLPERLKPAPFIFIPQ